MPQSVGYASGTSGSPPSRYDATSRRSRGGSTAPDQNPASRSRCSSSRSTGTVWVTGSGGASQQVDRASTRFAAVQKPPHPSQVPPFAPAPQAGQRPATRTWCRVRRQAAQARSDTGATSTTFVSTSSVSRPATARRYASSASGSAVTSYRMRAARNAAWISDP